MAAQAVWGRRLQESELGPRRELPSWGEASGREAPRPRSRSGGPQFSRSPRREWAGAERPPRAPPPRLRPSVRPRPLGLCPPVSVGKVTRMARRGRLVQSVQGAAVTVLACLRGPSTLAECPTPPECLGLQSNRRGLFTAWPRASCVAWTNSSDLGLDGTPPPNCAWCGVDGAGAAVNQQGGTGDSGYCPPPPPQGSPNDFSGPVAPSWCVDSGDHILPHPELASPCQAVQCWQGSFLGGLEEEVGMRKGGWMRVSVSTSLILAVPGPRAWAVDAFRLGTGAEALGGHMCPG